VRRLLSEAASGNRTGGGSRVWANQRRVGQRLPCRRADPGQRPLVTCGGQGWYGPLTTLCVCLFRKASGVGRATLSRGGCRHRLLPWDTPARPPVPARAGGGRAGRGSLGPATLLANDLAGNVPRVCPGGAPVADVPSPVHWYSRGLRGSLLDLAGAIGLGGLRGRGLVAQAGREAVPVLGSLVCGEIRLKEHGYWQRCPRGYLRRQAPPVEDVIDIRLTTGG
jgi:hypothetical protein